MKFNHSFTGQLLLSFTIIVSAAIFAVFFIFSSNSFAQETVPPANTQNVKPPEEIFDHDKAVAITKERGGPGGCKTESACADFCNNNQEACMTWAKDNGVISSDKFDKYIGFAKSGGPGGCKTEKECKSYCNNQAHFDECLSFAENQGIISKEDAARARKTGPGGCKTAEECNAFCENPANQDACINSAVADGFITAADAQKIREFKSKAEEFKKRAEGFKKQAEEFKPEIKEIDPGFNETKAKELIKTQGGPGGCKTFEECSSFCDSPGNQEACFSFAEANDLFQNKEAADKIKNIVKEGGPGGCKGEKACRAFCENPDNGEACLEFAQKNDLIKPEELEKAKKGIQALKNGGPAGCKTQQECETVCQNPANQEACFNWAKSNGLISEEDAKFIEESKKFREEFEQKKQEFENANQSRPNDFPGPSQFPGRPGEFPGKPPSGGFPPGQIPPGFEKQFQKQFEGFHPPEGFKIPEGFKPPEGFNPQQAPSGQFPQGFQPLDGFKVPEEFHQPTNFQPPAGFQPPTERSQPPSGTFTPPSGTFTPPPGELTPPPAQTPPPPPPSSFLQYSPFGAILNFFLGR